MLYLWAVLLIFGVSSVVRLLINEIFADRMSSFMDWTILVLRVRKLTQK